MENIETNPKVIKNITEKRMDKMDGIGYENSEAEKDPMSDEQEDVINKLEEALNFLKNNQINKGSLGNIKTPLYDLLSCLTYIPVKAPFDTLPTEIKTDILSYLCDTGAFVAASVCQDWKSILKTRIKKLEVMTVGKHCYDCESQECFMPEEVLKAASTHELDVPLSVCYPVENVDTGVLVEALTSVSSFKIDGGCDCNGDSEDFEGGQNLSTRRIKSFNEFEKLFDALEIQKKNERMISIDLRYLDFRPLNQRRIINYLLNKTMILTLDFGSHSGDYRTMFHVNLLVSELLRGSKLQILRLHDLFYPRNFMGRDFSVDMADALCNVAFLDTWPVFHFRIATIKRLIHNILNRPKIVLRSLDIGEEIDWRVLITPENLKIMLNKLLQVELRGMFTPDQVAIARSVPGVKTLASFMGYQISKKKIGQNSRS